MGCPIINPALSLLMKHLVIGQRQKATYLSAFHWSPHGSLVSIGQHFVTTRVIHLPKRPKTSFVTESDRSIARPSMFSVKAKIYGVIYNRSSSIAFDETSSYLSAPKAPNF